MRERQAARELAIPPLMHCEALLLTILVLRSVVLAGNRQPVVDHISIDLQVLLREPRQLKCRGHEVVLSILVDVHPIVPTVSILPH